MRPWLITLTHVLPTLAFFGPHSKTITNHRTPPRPRLAQAFTNGNPHGMTTINTNRTTQDGVYGHDGHSRLTQIEHGEAKHYVAGRTFTNTNMVMIRGDQVRWSGDDQR